MIPLQRPTSSNTLFPTTTHFDRSEYLGQQQGQKQVHLAANITGPRGSELASYPLEGLDFGESLSAGSDMGLTSITAQAEPDSLHKLRSVRRALGWSLGKRVGAPPPKRPLSEKGPLQYKLGQLRWDTEKNTTSVACSVGMFDNGNALDGFLTLSNDPEIVFLLHQNRQVECRFEVPTL